MSEADHISPAAPEPQPADRGDASKLARYERHKKDAADRIRRMSAASRTIPAHKPPANPARREACRTSLRKFAETYMAATFPWKWSPDHLRVIAKLEKTVTEGGQFAQAMPRGSGKTSLTVAAILWAVLFGYRRWVTAIGPEKDHAEGIIASVRSELENNPTLAEDFDAFTAPIRALGGITQRRLLTADGRQIRQSFSAYDMALANLDAQTLEGGMISARSLGGHIRGLQAKRADGSTIRPEMVILDDPQSDEVAANPVRIKKMLDLINGAVLGLGGPGVKLACIMPCTVVAKDDLADQLLDSERSPSWNGERTKLVYKFPANEALWREYATVRADGLRAGDRGKAGTKFYRANRRAMDEGAEVAWPERKFPGELSAIQHAMNIRLDRGDRAFFAEYQNEPLPDLDNAAEQLTTGGIIERMNGHPRGVVPRECTRITAFIDVQKDALLYAVAGWSENFSGAVVEYGIYPEQPVANWKGTELKKTLAMAYPGAGLEGAIRAGMVHVVAKLCGREWLDDAGTPRRIDRLLIDAGWGLSTDTVHAFIRGSEFGPVLLPSKGTYIGPESKPMSEYRRVAGERTGLNWRITHGERRRRWALFDTNYWKSFVRARLTTAPGDPGSLMLYGRHGKTDHELLAQHWTAEYSTQTTGRGRTVDVWKERRKGADNHWWDCIVGAAVAASIEGVEIAQHKEPKRQRVYRDLAAMQRAARAGG